MRARRAQPVGRVGLTAFETLYAERPRKTVDMQNQPVAQRRFVEGETVAHGRRGRLVLASPTHRPAFQSRLIFLARLHLWTSVGPS